MFDKNEQPLNESRSWTAYKLCAGINDCDISYNIWICGNLNKYKITASTSYCVYSAAEFSIWETAKAKTLYCNFSC